MIREPTTEAPIYKFLSHLLHLNKHSLALHTENVTHDFHLKLYTVGGLHSKLVWEYELVLELTLIPC